jgi:hypothetical protein
VTGSTSSDIETGDIEFTELTVCVVLAIGDVVPLINKSEEPVSSCTEYSVRSRNESLR